MGPNLVLSNKIHIVSIELVLVSWINIALLLQLSTIVIDVQSDRSVEGCQLVLDATTLDGALDLTYMLAALSTPNAFQAFQAFSLS